MNKLSVIVPYVHEFPQVIFTLQSIAQDMVGRANFEVIAIDNYCDEHEKQFQAGIDRVVSKCNEPVILQWAEEQRNRLKKGSEAVKACDRHNEWLKYLNYTEKLSHWQAKNMGVAESDGDVLWFCDSHCVVGRDSLFNMFTDYVENYDHYHGTLHMPVTYKILESRRLIYKLVFNWDTAEIHYSFTPLRPHEGPFEVPVMSNCGMMMSKEIYDDLGGWPTELGIYGGGENFTNFTLAVLGYKKWIYNDAFLFHHGDSRGYHWFYDDHVRNKIIAMYVYGGEALVRKFIKNTKGRPETLKNICNDVVAKCKNHREFIKARQKLSIDEWAKQWR